MTTLREAAQQALEALESKRYAACGWRSDCDKAITALRAALAEPVQEPIRWDASAPLVVHPHPAFQTAPPQRKPLTDEGLDALAIDEDGLPNSHIEFARAIEAAHGIKENT